MSSFNEMRDEIISIKTDITNMVNNLFQYSSAERPAKMQKIESRFGQILSSVSEVEEQIMMFDTNEKNDARKFLQQIKTDIKKLEMEYNEAKKKGSERDALFGNAQIRADGSSAGQMNNLYNQKEQIEEGDNLTDELARSVNMGKEAGTGILGELGRQKSTTQNIFNGLDELDNDVVAGENLIDRMICRNKRRTIFMIIIIVILVIAAGVFLYFIFRDK